MEEVYIQDKEVAIQLLNEGADFYDVFPLRIFPFLFIKVGKSHHDLGDHDIVGLNAMLISSNLPDDQSGSQPVPHGNKGANQMPHSGRPLQSSCPLTCVPTMYVCGRFFLFWCLLRRRLKSSKSAIPSGSTKKAPAQVMLASPLSGCTARIDRGGVRKSDGVLPLFPW
ncbi:hypothetical protein BGZ63DRAFT_154479 [Mariannaea sp. PMI_226]|nr:hypothetical protein BGZ63DRAFT_154479 [Mariannaea sp. PMI_226]